MRHGHEEIDIMTRNLKIKPTTEAQMIFLNPFNVCSSRKWKFVCMLVDEETNRSYLFANGTKRTKQTWLRQQDLENTYQPKYLTANVILSL
jgi:hypothetical protein